VALSISIALAAAQWHQLASAAALRHLNSAWRGQLSGSLYALAAWRGGWLAWRRLAAGVSSWQRGESWLLEGYNVMLVKAASAAKKAGGWRRLMQRMASGRLNQLIYRRSSAIEVIKCGNGRGLGVTASGVTYQRRMAAASAAAYHQWRRKYQRRSALAANVFVAKYVAKYISISAKPNIGG